MHSQTMNGLRRSFLCRVKKSNTQKSSQISTDYPVPEVDSENVIKLLQSAQQSIPYQYVVLYCTGFIRCVDFSTIMTKVVLHLSLTEI